MVNFAPWQLTINESTNLAKKIFHGNIKYNKITYWSVVLETGNGSQNIQKIEFNTTPDFLFLKTIDDQYSNEVCKLTFKIQADGKWEELNGALIVFNQFILKALNDNKIVKGVDFKLEKNQPQNPPNPNAENTENKPIVKKLELITGSKES